MRAFKIPGKTPPSSAAATGMSKGEKRKLLAMGVGLVLVVMAFAYSASRRSAYRDAEQQDLPLETPRIEETVRIPEIDAARIDALVSDAEPIDRVVLESDALDVMLADVRALTPRHFDAMQADALDAARIAELVAAPSEHRAEPWFVRGEIDDLRTRRRTATGEVETIGRLRLDDGSMCYFLVLDAPDSLQDTGGYVRVDGLFLKVFSDEDELNPGAWIEAPLLVGPRAIRSYRPFGEVTEPSWAILGAIEDADLEPADGSAPRIVRETPFEARWHMMAYARDVPEGAIDWESVPELDRELMTRLEEEPETWRGQPVRIPISRIQDARVKLAGENPARIERYTDGWIGNWAWPNVVKFQSPIPNFDVHLSDFAYGRGFFVQEFAYDSAGRSLRSAPFLVLTSLTRYEPEDDPVWQYVAVAFVAFTFLLIALLTYFVLRDRRRSRELQNELARRRRARRSHAGAVSVSET